MERKLLKRKSWSDENGVSEIIGNILILMITVVLFSGIMMFVNQLPVPEMTTKADFSAGVTFDTSGTVATLTVTHIGGAAMMATETVILVSLDDETHSIRLSEDADFTHEEWTTGLKWTETYSGTSYSSSIFVTIVDDVAHNAVWASQVSGGMGNTPPTVLQRYVDSNSETFTADPVKQNDNFTLFVKISDLDGDLNEVWVDNTSFDLPVVSDHITPTRPVSVPGQGGWFEWDFFDVVDDVTQVDGKTLIIYARDNASHTTVVPYKLSVIVLPTDIEWYESPDEPQEGGMPSYIKRTNEGQGFAIFGELNDTGVANILDPRTNFTRGEKVFIRAASLYVTNLFGGNDLKFTDARTGLDLTYFVDFIPVSSSAEPFYNYAYGGNVAVYQCIFDTDGMMPGTYLVHATLASTGVVNYNFVFDETLFIEDPDSPMTYYPNVWVSTDSSFATCWGATKATPFNATGANSVMYVAISVQDAQETPDPSLGEIRIVDMTGGTELYGPPNSGSPTMISAIVDSANASAYFFSIDLKYNNGDLWKLGSNSYTLQITQFSDQNEGVYAYSLQVFIRAPSARSDFIVGTSGIYSSMGGSTNFISPENVYHIENNNFFTMRILYYTENAPSTSPLYYQNAMAMGDLDNDGDLDVLVGSNMDNSGAYPNNGRLLYFENTMSTFGVWQSPSLITRPSGDVTTSKIKWIDTGDFNGDGYTDFAYATNEPGVWIFRNTYGAVGTEFPVSISESTNDGVRKLALQDMNGDGCDDLILLRQGRVEVYDLQLTWGATALIAEIPNTSVTTNSNIEDFDIVDVNCDGMLDIITIDPGTSSHSDIKGVWVNNYTANAAPDEKLVVSSTQIAGQIASGQVSYTEEVDDLYLVLRENTSVENAPNGTVSFVFKVGSTGLSSFDDQQLVVNASLSSGSQEVFYVWYSTDPDPRTAKYTPVMLISGTTARNYTFNLPSNCVDADYFYVKITDSSSQVGGVIETINVNYIAVLSDLYGSYWPNPMIPVPNRYQITSDTSYTTARGMNFDGLSDGRLEVVIAKNGAFVVYDHKTAVAVWTYSSMTDMFVQPTSATGLTGGAIMLKISPTLFHVADINGDGMDDIVTTWISQGDSNEYSLIKAYVNVGPTIAPWAVNVKDLFAGILDGAEKGSILSIVIGDIFNRS